METEEQGYSDLRVLLRQLKEEQERRDSQLKEEQERQYSQLKAELERRDRKQEERDKKLEETMKSINEGLTAFQREYGGRIAEQEKRMEEIRDQMDEVIAEVETKLGETGEKFEELEASQADMKAGIEEIKEKIEETEKRMVTKFNQQSIRKVTDLDEGILMEITRRVKEDCARLTLAPTAVGAVQMKIPSFDGRHNARPMRYLQELREYWEMYRLTEDDALRVVRQGMIGKAGEWFAATQHLYGDFATFRTMFQEQYWGEERQIEVRRALETGKYPDDDRQTRVEYATSKISVAKELRPPIDDKSLVYLLRQHFGVEVSVGMVSHNVSSLQQFLALLARYDRIPGEDRHPGPTGQRRWFDQNQRMQEERNHGSQRRQEAGTPRWVDQQPQQYGRRPFSRRQDERRPYQSQGYYPRFERENERDERQDDRQQGHDDITRGFRSGQRHPINSLVVENSEGLNQGGKTASEN
ncbi:trichohyalin-like [Ischnura elegans]|uniref:trichohyalin-like n=1 Tax=Ischnura elegans TaxID=197161 RepID=UPI001ED88816|nr:trichohyalin-like [Ischnura elegans]